MLLNSRSIALLFSLFMLANSDDTKNYQDVARWLVQNNEWGTISVSEMSIKGSETKHFQRHPFVNVDGVHNKSSGSIYLHGQPMVDSYLHKYAASGQKLAFSINPSNSYECLSDHRMDLDDWQCTRLVITGSLMNVTDWEEIASVKKVFKERHDLSLDTYTDLTYRLSITEMRLIQVLTGDSLKVDLGLYERSRREMRTTGMNMNMNSSEISLDDKDFVRKMKAVHQRRKHLRLARAVV